MANVVTEFTIDRNTWLRGEGSVGSYLKRECDGKQCCLGFYALACGYSEGAILNGHTIEDLGPFAEQTVWLCAQPVEDENLDIADGLMSVNDEINSDYTYREEFITKTFAKQGIAVTFIN